MSFAVQQKPLSPIEQLITIMTMECEATESLFKVLSEQQEAVISYSGEELEYSTERCSEMIRRVRALEKDRLRILEKALQGTSAENFSSSPYAFERLMSVVDNRGGLKSRLKTISDRLRVAVASVVHKNLVNSKLLEHSMNYAQHNIKMITSEYSRQFIDKKL